MNKKGFLSLYLIVLFVLLDFLIVFFFIFPLNLIKHNIVSITVA